MKKFSDFGIHPDTKKFTGDKVKMWQVLNTEILVHDFKIEPSKHTTGKCLYMQIELENVKRVLFTGSTVLMDVIQKIPKDGFPFLTKIIKPGEYYQFT